MTEFAEILKELNDFSLIGVVGLGVLGFFFVKKNGNGNSRAIEEAIVSLGDNHIHHLGEDIKQLIEKTDGLVTGQAVEIEILREIRDNLRK